MKFDARLLSLMMIPAFLGAQGSTRPEMLVVGTYHMSNPARDLTDVHADDVLAPTRQAEIAQLVEVLQWLHPTKIAIEAASGSARVGHDHAEYAAGRYTLAADKSDQIGYRLAEELGHKAVYPIDIPGDFPWEHVVNYAKANGRPTMRDSLVAAVTARAQVQDRFLQSHTILQTLQYLNSDSVAAADVSSYFRVIPLGDPDDEAGPDLVAVW